MPQRYLWLVIPLLVMCGPVQAQGNGNGDRSNSDDLESLLVKVGTEYAKAYLSPLAHSWGANQNSGLYHTAKIPRSRLTFAFGLKVMGTYTAAEDQTFRRVIRSVPLNDYLDLQPGDPGYGEVGDIVLEGSTVIGDPDTKGTATGYINGIPIYSMGTIGGLVETRWVPLFAPEVQLGGIAGLRGSLRWLPEIKMGDFGKTKYMGWGLQWSPGYLLPPLPVDVLIGFFRQEINLGTIVETSSSSVFVAASKSFALATIYGGLSKESSTMKVNYTMDNVEQTNIGFEIDGDMGSRLTLGVTLNLGAKINAEMGVGKLTVYTAGLLFGF